jgi:hypothetical protein
MRLALAFALLALAQAGAAAAQPAGTSATPPVPNFNSFVDALTNPGAANRNRPEREVWLQDNGFGVFVTWGLDSQLGIVISHSLVGASDDHFERYVRELPRSFAATAYDAPALARLIRRSGARYALLTTKHIQASRCGTRSRPTGT